MTTKLTAFCGAMVLFLALTCAAQDDRSPSTGEVLISASDKHGNSASLSTSSVVVHVDKQEMSVVELKPATDAPLRFVVLVDLSGSQLDRLKFERDAASQIFHALSKPNNEGFLGYIRNTAGISDHPMQAAEVDRLLAGANPSGATALHDGIVIACQKALHRDTQFPRRILFVISDGADTASHSTVEEAAKVAQREGVPIFALGLLSSDVPGMDALSGRGRAALKKFAEETGGNAVLLESPKEFLRQLLRPLDAEYFLTFRSPSAEKGVLQQLDVVSNEKTIKIAAPKAYSPR